MENQLTKSNHTRLLGREEKTVVFVEPDCWLIFGEKDGLLCPSNPESDLLSPTSDKPPTPLVNLLPENSGSVKGKKIVHLLSPQSSEIFGSSFCFKEAATKNEFVPHSPVSDEFVSAQSDLPLLDISNLEIGGSFSLGPSSSNNKGVRKCPLKVKLERQARSAKLVVARGTGRVSLPLTQSGTIDAVLSLPGCSKKQKVQRRYHGRGELRFGFVNDLTYSESNVSSDSTARTTGVLARPLTLRFRSSNGLSLVCLLTLFFFRKLNVV